MSGKMPSFITGANAAIRIDNGKIFAFATDVAYSITIKHVQPHILGQYEAHNPEPVSYEVVGSFSLLRYAQGMGDQDSPSESGNGIGNWGRGGVSGFFLGGNPQDNLNPVTFDTCRYFDIEIYAKIRNEASGREGLDWLAEKAEIVFGRDTTTSIGNSNVVLVAKLKDCKITRADMIINKNSIAVQKFTFFATYCDEDSFRSVQSGRGQRWS